MTYDECRSALKQALADGRCSGRLTRAERIDFAYGNARLSNPDVTREMVERAVDDVTLRDVLVAPEFA